MFRTENGEAAQVPCSFSSRLTGGGVSLGRHVGRGVQHWQQLFDSDEENQPAEEPDRPESPIALDLTPGPLSIDAPQNQEPADVSIVDLTETPTVCAPRNTRPVEVDLTCEMDDDVFVVLVIFTIF